MPPVYSLVITLLLIPSVVFGADSFWKTLTWNTVDGVQMVGLYHAASQPGDNTWVLLHGLGSNKEEWQAFGQKLGAQGDGVFIYDARGHHESIHTTTGQTLNYQEWKNAGAGSPWDAMPSDLASAIQILETNEKVAENKIAVGGASLGANVALVYASEHAAVPGLVLLSPGMEYAGIQAGPAYQTYNGRPVFIAASPGDLYAYSSVRQLMTLADNHAVRAVPGKSGHGVNMLDDDFTKKLLEWMKGLDGNRNRRPS